MLCFTIAPMAPDVMLFKAMQIPLHIGVPLFFLISGYFGIRFSLKGLMRYVIKGLFLSCSFDSYSGILY